MWFPWYFPPLGLWVSDERTIKTSFSSRHVLTGMACSAAAATLLPASAADSYQCDTHQAGALTFISMDSNCLLKS